MGKIKYLILALLGVAFISSFMACLSDEDYKLKLVQSVNLFTDGGCALKSEEPLIAEVDNDGNVTANIVSETAIWG